MTDASGGPPRDEDAPLLPEQRSRRRDPEPPLTPSASDAPVEPGDPTAVFQAHVRAARSELENQVAHARAEFDQANERIKERTGRDLILAIAIGLAIGVVVISSLIFLTWPFVIVALAAACLGVFEFGRALQGAGRRVDVVPQVIAGAVLVVAAWFLETWLQWVMVFAAVAVVVVWRLVAQMVSKDGRRYGDVLDDALVAGFIQLYVPFTASLCVLLLRQDNGAFWVLSFLIIAVAADTGAYVTGLLIGRHPMAPRISPKKTWEGFAGATAASLIAGVLVAVFLLHLPLWTGLILGAVILCTATAGDLGESMIKRDLGIKDMSSWLPGHGGVLDRLDSILLSAPATLALCYLLTPLVTT